MVDEDGRPKVVLHGTPNKDFYAFEPGKIGSGTDAGWVMGSISLAIILIMLVSTLGKMAEFWRFILTSRTHIMQQQRSSIGLPKPMILNCQGNSEKILKQKGMMAFSIMAI